MHYNHHGEISHFNVWCIMHGEIATLLLLNKAIVMVNSSGILAFTGVLTSGRRESMLDETSNIL